MFRIHFKSSVKVDPKKAKMNKAATKKRKQEALESNNPRMVSLIPYGLKNGKNTKRGKHPKGGHKFLPKPSMVRFEEQQLVEHDLTPTPTPVQEAKYYVDDTVPYTVEDERTLAIRKLQEGMERLGMEINGLLSTL